MGKQLGSNRKRRGSHGGRRAGAGRKSNRAKGLPWHVPHGPRDALTRHTPVHVTLRVVPEVGKLRRLECYRALRLAMAKMFERLDSFRICHASIQSDHVHLIIEAEDRDALTRGMTSFQVSAARKLNAVLGRRPGVPRRGSVFSDRYQDEPLTSPAQVKNALGHVLNNWRRHGEDRGSHLALDPFATGGTFDGFAEHREPLWHPGDEPLPVAFPTSWLLSTGWRQHGLLSTRQVPGRQR
jgi:REP element-mobilizing transposase RayT